MNSVHDYLGALRGKRRDLVVRAAEAGELASSLKELATIQLAIIAFEAVAYEKEAAHHFDAAMSEFKLTHGVA
ncbi:hypothetical protein [Agrobacterium sp. YIC 4121]|uniref:hypothetical protein n=1 Tax=Agrobacterium sp. YIC 4121 TaxID=1923829 RepID=UPI00098F2D3D|nr:hypothetical protein [Agrobacterium sp. YIC 4121]OOO25562.1 hypothetical protein BTE54_23380 [Agrobacterium sp. YIC 4121]